MCPLYIFHDARYDFGTKCDSLGKKWEKIFSFVSVFKFKALLRQILDGGEDGDKVN